MDSEGIMAITNKPRGNITHYYAGSGVNTYTNITRKWVGMAIINDNALLSLTFTINLITVSVKAGEHFDDDFEDFDTITVNSGSYRLVLRG